MMKITVLSHDLSSNAAMRAHRLAQAAATFASVELLGPVDPDGIWPALPHEPWIRSVPKARFPQFLESFQHLIETADGDVLIAVKPHLASFAAALVAAERRSIPVILDLDDLDVALAPRSDWDANPSMTDLGRPGSAVYVSLLTKCVTAASAITVASTALQRRFGGALIPHGCDTALFDPVAVDRAQARDAFEFAGPTVLFPGAPREHKGLRPLALAVEEIPGVRLVVTCRPGDLADQEWKGYPLVRIPMVPYSSLPKLLAAADIIAVPQLDTEPAAYQTPMKIFEAMAMAKPIVATTVGDLPEILGGCGKLVPPGDAGVLASTIGELLRHPDEAEALGARSRERCLRHYSIRETAERLATVIAQLHPVGRTSMPVKNLQGQTHDGRHDRASHRVSDAVCSVPVGLMPGVLSDLALPFLSHALDPLEFQRELRPGSFRLAETGGPIEVRKIQVLRYKPARRCLIEYEVALTGAFPESVTLLGKASARAPVRKYRIQEALWHAGFQSDSPDEISVPEPLGMLPEWNLWLQRKVCGTGAASLLEQDGSLEPAHRIADALHKLHQSRVEASRTHTLADELRILHEKIGRVIAMTPHLAARLDRILVSCNELAGVILQSPLCGIHRDFYADQVIFNGRRLYLLDFDLYSEGDPALDAGNFIGHLTEQSLRRWGHPHGLARCEETFKERFLQLSSETREEAVQAYAVLTLVRHIFLSTRLREGLDHTEALIDLCEKRVEVAKRACQRNMIRQRSASERDGRMPRHSD